MATKPLIRDDATKSFAIGATAGLAVGLIANIARKAVVQAPTTLAGDWDQALAAEHKIAFGIFDAIQNTTDSQTTKRSVLLMQLKHALGKHAFQEENVVYPMLRDNGQTTEADHLNDDHGYVKQYLHELTMLPRDNPGWLPKVNEFRTRIEQHVREEENEIFPRLKAQLSAEENKKVTTAMNKEGLKLA